jgi:hypothetical protein
MMLIYFRRVVSLIVGNWEESEASMRASQATILLCLLVLVSCSQPEPYVRLIIDTYPPTAGPGSVDTRITLFNASGNQVAADSSGNPTWVGFARIDSAGELLPGTWYIKVEGEAGTELGPYAIRVLLVPDETYGPWRFGSYNNPDPYENDGASTDNVPSSPIPIAIDGKLNRYLTAGDVDWFTLTLP